jgi:hypothetical protein
MIFKAKSSPNFYLIANNRKDASKILSDISHGCFSLRKISYNEHYSTWYRWNIIWDNTRTKVSSIKGRNEDEAKQNAKNLFRRIASCNLIESDELDSWHLACKRAGGTHFKY